MERHMKLMALFILIKSISKDLMNAVNSYKHGLMTPTSTLTSPHACAIYENVDL